jgi:nucleolar protein 58
MLVLFETPAGYALFKVTDEKKLADGEALQKEFETPEGAAKMIKLKAFAKFQDTVEVRTGPSAKCRRRLRACKFQFRWRSLS